MSTEQKEPEPTPPRAERFEWLSDLWMSARDVIRTIAFVSGSITTPLGVLLGEPRTFGIGVGMLALGALLWWDERR